MSKIRSASARVETFARLLWLCWAAVPFRRVRDSEDAKRWVAWVLEPLEREKRR